MPIRGAEWMFQCHIDSYLSDAPSKPPEKRLLASILVRAAQDAVSNHGIRPHERRSARQWFGLNRPFYNPKRFDGEAFSFIEICEHLEICPHTVHRQLKALMMSGGVSKQLVSGNNGSVIRSLYE